MTLAAISIPGFNNGVSQQAPVNRRPDQGEIQINGLGTLVDGLMQRPGTEFLAVLTSNAENGVFTHSINRDTTFRYIVLMTGDPTEPIEIFDLAGVKQTVQYGDLDADLNYTRWDGNKNYAIPGCVWAEWEYDDTYNLNWVTQNCTTSDSANGFYVNESSGPSQNIRQPFDDILEDGRIYQIYFTTANVASEPSVSPYIAMTSATFTDEDWIIAPTTTDSWATYSGIFKSHIDTYSRNTLMFYTTMGAGERYRLKNLWIRDITDSISSSGSNLVANGGFDTSDGWTVGSGWTISGGVATHTAASGTAYLQYPIDATLGKTYKITYTLSGRTAGSVRSNIGPHVSGYSTSNGVQEYYVEYSSGTAYINFAPTTDFDGSVDNVTVEEVTLTEPNPSEVFKAVTVADNTFVINRGITVGKTTDVDTETLDYTVQTFADLPATPADGETAKITGDDISGFSAWYVQWDNTNSIWEECIKPGEELGRFKDYTMAHRLVRTSTTTFTFAPCIWEDRTVGDANTAPDPSFITNKLQNVFFFKNRLAFLSEDNVIFSETGEYFNFYPKTALDVLDSDPIDGSATSKQVEILRSVAVFDKSLILLADQQQFDLGSGEGSLTPTSIAITPTTRFNICPLCEPVTAGPNVYFVCPKTDYATIREYYVQPESLLNDAADITAHVPSYIPMGHIQMAACNSLDMLLVHTDADPDAIYLYKYFWSGEDKAQAAWSQWTFSGDILGFAIIGTIAYFVIEDADTSEITLEKMELETTTTGNLSFRVHADRQEDVAGTYDSTINRTTFDLSYQIASAEDMMAVIHPTTGRPIVEAAPKEYGANVITNGTFATDTNWNKGTGWSISGGTANCDGTQPDTAQTLNQTLAVVVSTVYRVRYTLSACTAGAVRCQVGAAQGTERTTNGTYEEVITCTDHTTFYFTCDADFIGSIDNVVVEPVATVTDKIEVTGDFSGTTYLIAKKFNFQWRMTPWYLQDANGRPRLQGRLQVRSLVLNYDNTGYFKVEVTPTGRTTMTHEFSGAVIGVSYLGQVTLLSGESRFMILARNTEVDVDIVSDSYFPVAFQSGSWEGVYYPRGRE